MCGRGRSALALALALTAGAKEDALATEVVRVFTSDELVSAAVGPLVKLQTAGVPDTLVVELAPGSYRDVTVNLTDPASAGVVAITVRAAEPGTVVLSNVHLHLEGTDLRVEGLIFDGARRASPVIAARVGRSLTIERVAMLDHAPKGRRGAPMISVDCSYGTGGKQLTVRDAWFVGNRQPAPSALIAARTVQPDVVDQLLLERVAMISNAYDLLLAPAFARAVVWRDSFVWVAPGGGPIGRIDTAASTWSATGSTFAVDNVAASMSLRSTKPLDEQPPVDLGELWVRAQAQAPLTLAGVTLHPLAADAPDPSGAARQIAERLGAVDLAALRTAAGM